MSAIRLVPALLITLTGLSALATTGCDRIGGFIITDDGRALALTPENMRSEQERSLTIRIEETLGKEWRAWVKIAENPYRTEDTFGNEDWRYKKATVTVELLSAEELAAERKAQVVAAVRKAMGRQVDRRDENLVTTVTSRKPSEVAPPAAPVAAAQPAAAPAVATPAPAADPTKPRSYVVQAGDTLALISSAFYGSSQHWRRILDANPGAENLTPGMKLVIPAAP